MSVLIPLTKGKTTVIDSEDFEKVSAHKWLCGGTGYARRSVIVEGKKKSVHLSRFLMNTPDDLVCDHINHNPLDNRKSNLRNVTQSINCQNRRML